MIDPTVLLWIVILLAYLGLCYVVGRLALDAVVQPAPPALVAGAVLIGATLLTLQLWAFGVVRLPWNALTLLLPWMVIAGLRRERMVTLVGEERQRVERLGRALSTLNGLELILVVAGTLIVLAYLLSLVAKPLYAWDAIDAWLFKAKAYYGQQAVDLQALSAYTDRSLDYPPLYSLMASSLYALLGQAIDQLGKAVTVIFVLAGAASLLTALSRWLNRQLAITFTFVLVALPMFAPALLTGAYMGYADYPVGICMMISLLHFYDGETSGQPLSYLFAVVFAAIAALLKNEGLVFLLIVVVLLGIHLVMWGRVRRPARRDAPILVALLVAMVPVVAWQAYVHVAGVSYSGVGQIDVAKDLPLLPSRAVTIVKFLATLASKEAVSTGLMRPPPYGDMPWLAASFLLSGVLLALNRFRIGTLIWIAIGAQAMSYFVVYLFTPLDLTFHLVTSADRLVMELAPSIVLMLAIALRPYLAARAVAALPLRGRAREGAVEGVPPAGTVPLPGMVRP
jgi:hypothetical protein